MSQSQLQDRFVRLCGKGLLNTARYLYLKYSGYIWNYTLNEAFRAACWDGHLEVAQWLITIHPSIDISAEDEVAFTSACGINLKLAQWLLLTKPDINISIRNDVAFHQISIFLLMTKGLSD